MVNVCATLGGFGWPPWVAAEFDAPIPFDAPAWLVKKAEAEASETMRLTENTSEPDAPLCLEVFEALKRSLVDLSRFVGQQFNTLDDVKLWCEGDGKDYRPCH